MKNLYTLVLLVAILSCGCGTPTGPDTPVVGQEYTGKGDWFGDERPYADMYNATSSLDMLPVRGRLVEEEEEDINDPLVTPWHLLTEDEIKREAAEFTLLRDDKPVFLGALTTDKEGYFDAVIDASSLGLEAGRYEVEVRTEGRVAGTYWVTLLKQDRTAPVVRSDVDLTYLDTDFQSASAMFGLMSEDATEKTALPGMPAVYQALRGDDVHPLTFLSGSPRFFKRTLEFKMFYDYVAQDGLVLKPMKDIIAINIRDLEVSDIVPELKEQIGYKLFWLLKLRSQLPNATPEILMGDDSEADHVVYNLYARFLSEEMDAKSLSDQLKTLEVSEAWAAQVNELAAKMDTSAIASPLAIYINKTDVAAEVYSVEDWAIDGLTVHHAGAQPLVDELQANGWVDQDGADSVASAVK